MAEGQGARLTADELSEVLAEVTAALAVAASVSRDPDKQVQRAAKTLSKIIRHVDALVAENARLVAALEERTELLEVFVEAKGDEPCRFDHHGNCQTHGVAEPPCYVAEARVALTRRADGGEEGSHG